jgi:hypothetical protein
MEGHFLVVVAIHKFIFFTCQIGGFSNEKCGVRHKYEEAGLQQWEITNPREFGKLNQMEETIYF